MISNGDIRCWYSFLPVQRCMNSTLTHLWGRVQRYSIENEDSPTTACCPLHENNSECIDRKGRTIMDLQLNVSNEYEFGQTPENSGGQKT